MNRPWGLIYTLTGLIVLIGLAILFILRLNAVREATIAEADASYARIAAELGDEADLISMGLLLDRYFADGTTAESVALYFPQRGMVFLRARDPRLTTLSRAELATFSGFPTYDIGEISWMLNRSELESNEFTDLYFDVVYRVVTLQDIYPLLRDTLIILLVFALILVAVAMLQSGRSRALEETGAAHRRHVKPETEADVEREPGVVSAPAQPLVVPETHADAASDTETEEGEIEVEEVSADETEPGSLFDPATGISFEEHLSRKLGLELERAAYNDQDLSCMVISFPGSPSSEKRSRWARNILDAFQFEDLCFSYGESTFCVILPNTELPQAIRQATEFQLKYGPDAIGLSARNGRLVEANRVLKEASRSLAHARTSPSRVVGFRPDPSKYRQFVSDRSS